MASATVGDSSPSTTLCFAAASAYPGRLAILPAQAIASARRSASGTTRFTAPHASARCAVIGAPSSTSSSARARPTMRGRRLVPPAPGMMPMIVSGCPKVADSAAMRRSQAQQNSAPPPHA